MKQVTREEYMAFFKGKNLKPISSFSDPEGILSFGYGCPAMDTDWGNSDEDEPYARCEMRKDHRLQEEWEYTYFIR